MGLILENIRLPLAHIEVESNCTFDGSITALFGPTGSGKTTILEIIAGLRKRCAGKVLLNDRVLQDGKIFVPPRLRKVGYVPQDIALFPHLSVTQNIRYGKRGDSIPRFSFEGICDILGLRPLLSQRTETLSGGEKQRVAFARALFAEPDILLLDEPLSSLDYAMKHRIVSHLLKIRDEFHIPMILVTHSSEEVMALCDRVIILEAGEVIRQGTPDDLFEKSDRYLYYPRT